MEIVKPKRHSYSSLGKYEKCAAQWKFSYLDKLPDPSGPAAKRGTRLHLSGELFLKGELPKLPVEYWRLEKNMADLHAAGAKAEAVWLLDDLWCGVSQDADAWLKAIVDIHYLDGPVLHVADLKTGQVYDSHVDQLRLYAVMGMCLFPEVEEVRVSALYIDQGVVGSEFTYTRAMLDGLKSHYAERIDTMLADESYAPDPDPRKCSMCPYSRKRGGQCHASA